MVSGPALTALVTLALFAIVAVYHLGRQSYRLDHLSEQQAKLSAELLLIHSALHRLELLIRGIEPRSED